MESVWLVFLLIGAFVFLGLVARVVVAYRRFQEIGQRQKERIMKQALELVKEVPEEKREAFLQGVLR